MAAAQKILVVDDDSFILKILETSLNNHPDYEPVTARDGIEALEKAQNDKFDLIITDVIMPGKDGIQFIEELRKVDKETPVIVITGGNEGEDSDIDQFFNFACYFSNDTLKKPFTQDELYQAMGLALNNRDVDLLNFL